MSRPDWQSKPHVAAQIAAQTGVAALKGKGRGKYRNEKIEAHGRVWDSKLELRVYERLCARYGRDSVIPQVSLPIGAKRLRVDFLAILERREDGSFVGRFHDAKGVLTEAWTAKANHLEDRYGLEIRLER